MKTSSLILASSSLSLSALDDESLNAYWAVLLPIFVGLFSRLSILDDSYRLLSSLDSSIILLIFSYFIFLLGLPISGNCLRLAFNE